MHIDVQTASAQLALFVQFRSLQWYDQACGALSAAAAAAEEGRMLKPASTGQQDPASDSTSPSPPFMHSQRGPVCGPEVSTTKGHIVESDVWIATSVCRVLQFGLDGACTDKH